MWALELASWALGSAKSERTLDKSSAMVMVSAWGTMSVTTLARGRGAIFGSALHRYVQTCLGLPGTIHSTLDLGLCPHLTLNAWPSVHRGSASNSPPDT